jgi:hypothetical protein
MNDFYLLPQAFFFLIRIIRKEFMRNFYPYIGKQVLGIESLGSIEGESFSTLFKFIVDLLDVHLKYNGEKVLVVPIAAVMDTGL